jgi:hypothetical protein
MHEYTTKQLVEEIVKRSNALEYYSTKELIEEIIGRSTFAGIIFHSNIEAKGEQSPLFKGWDINYRNIPESEIAELLQIGAAHFNQLAENG